MVIDDAWKSVSWNASSYGNALEPKRKEKTIKGDWCNPAKDPPTIKSIFSLEHKDGKLWIVELTFVEWDLILL